MIARAPQQLGLDLHIKEAQPPVDPRTLGVVRVDRMGPAAPDGERFWRDVLVVALRVARARGMVHPSDLRIAAELEGVKPPHPNWWGSLAAKLKSAGWVQRYAPQRSPITSRNGAIEHMAYSPPEVQP